MRSNRGMNRTAQTKRKSETSTGRHESGDAPDDPPEENPCPVALVGPPETLGLPWHDTIPSAGGKCAAAILGQRKAAGHARFERGILEPGTLSGRRASVLPMQVAWSTTG